MATDLDLLARRILPSPPPVVVSKDSSWAHINSSGIFLSADAASAPEPFVASYIAHELAHFVTPWAPSLARNVPFLALVPVPFFLLWVVSFQAALLSFAFLVPAYLLLTAAALRRVEFYADKVASELLSDSFPPGVLADALEYASRRVVVFPARPVLPDRFLPGFSFSRSATVARFWLATAFSSHPPIDKRVLRLRALV